MFDITHAEALKMIEIEDIRSFLISHRQNIDRLDLLKKTIAEQEQEEQRKGKKLDKLRAVEKVKDAETSKEIMVQENEISLQNAESEHLHNCTNLENNDAREKRLMWPAGDMANNISGNKKLSSSHQVLRHFFHLPVEEKKTPIYVMK